MNDQVIKDLVAKRVARGDLFTAYDVSKDAQNNGMRVRHLHLKDITHQLYADGDMMGYEKTLIDLGNGLQAFVYHPHASDPFDYKSKHLSGVTPVSAMKTQVIKVTSKSPDAIDCILDAENRLNIPVDFFEHIGLNPHDEIGIEFLNDEDKIIIDSYASYKLISCTTIKRAVITAKGNYRLCQRMRDQITSFIDVTDFTISVKTDGLGNKSIEITLT